MRKDNIRYYKRIIILLNKYSPSKEITDEILANLNDVNIDEYRSYRDRINLDKFKTICGVYTEQIYKAYVANKTKRWLPTSHDHSSIKYFQEKYKDAEIGLRKYKEFHKNKNNTNKLEYYLKLGFNEDEAKIKLKERQATFSLEKCIKKYGEPDGKLIFQKRQEKWQCSLNNKSEIEIAYINFKKDPKLSCYIKDVFGIDYLELTIEWFENTICSTEYGFEDLTFKQYSCYVNIITTKNKKFVENINLRGKEYHLDHMISKKYGYLKKIHPYYIGHPRNLKIMPASENLKKSWACSQTFEELLNRIEEYERNRSNI